MYINLKYAGHIAMLTGKTKEPMDVGEVDSIASVIKQLDKKYCGFKDVFMPKGKIFNFNTSIYLRRIGEPTSSIIDENQKVKKGDVLFFW